MHFFISNLIYPTQLAEMAGILQPNLSRIDQGRYNTGFDLLQRIADALGMQIDITEL